MKTTDFIDQDSLRTDIPEFGPGDELKVHVRVVEGGKERVQVFQGNVISIRGGGLQETYTVRKLSYGVGVERTFPMHTPTVAKVEGVEVGINPTSIHRFCIKNGLATIHPNVLEENSYRVHW